VDTIGGRILELRESLDLSQADLAGFCHVWRQSVSQWERDRAVPEGRHLQALAVALHTTPNYLLMGEELTPEERLGVDLALNPPIAGIVTARLQNPTPGQTLGAAAPVAVPIYNDWQRGYDAGHVAGFRAGLAARGDEQHPRGLPPGTVIERGQAPVTRNYALPIPPVPAKTHPKRAREALAAGCCRA